MTILSQISIKLRIFEPYVAQVWQKLDFAVVDRPRGQAPGRAWCAWSLWNYFPEPEPTVGGAEGDGFLFVFPAAVV